MEYYSAIKRNEIVLFVVRWMDLESVIQSEVSQKEKNKYCMLTHIYGIEKKNGSHESRGRTGIKTQTQRMDLRTRGGGRVSWDEVREWHGHIYTTKCKIASGKQLHSKGRSAQCFVTTWRGGIRRVGGRCKREEIW